MAFVTCVPESSLMPEKLELPPWDPGYVAMKRWQGFCSEVIHCGQTGFGGTLHLGSGTQVIVMPSKCVFSPFCGLICL